MRNQVITSIISFLNSLLVLIDDGLNKTHCLNLFFCTFNNAYMKEEVKTAWIDENNKIVSFHVIDNGKLIMKPENQFWNFIFGLTNTGYRIL